MIYCIVQHEDQRMLSSSLLSSPLLSGIPFLFYTLIKKEKKYIKGGTEAVRMNEVRTSKKMETKRWVRRGKAREKKGDVPVKDFRLLSLEFNPGRYN